MGVITGKTVMKSNIDRHFKHNTFSISSAELFWGMGTPIIIESTFLQLFLRRLGASSFLIGLVPSLFFIGVALTGILSGFFTSHLSRKKTAVAITHMGGAIWMPLFGVFFLVFGEAGSMLPLFFICYGGFALSMGLMAPVWHNFIVSLFSEKRVFKALSVMVTVQNIGKLISSFIIAGVVEKYAFSNRASAFILIFVGVTFFAGSFFFLLARETEETQNRKRIKKLRTHFTSNLITVLKYPRFMLYLISNIENYAVIGVISFYANFATEYCGVSETIAAGFFVTAIYGGYFSVTVVFGWLNFLSIKKKLLLGKFCSITGIALLLVFEHPFWFITVSYLLGVARGIRILTYSPTVKILSGKRDATNFFSLAALLLLPFSVGIPLINGSLLDRFSYLPWGGYRLVFSIMGILSLAGLSFLLRLRFPHESPGTSSSATRKQTV